MKTKKIIKALEIVGKICKENNCDFDCKFYDMIYGCLLSFTPEHWMIEEINWKLQNEERID